MRPNHNASVYLHVQPVDFRKSINGLAQIVELETDLMDRHRTRKLKNRLAWTGTAQRIVWTGTEEIGMDRHRRDWHGQAVRQAKLANRSRGAIPLLDKV